MINLKTILSKTSFKKPSGFSIMSLIICVGVLIWLGMWQVERGVWKYTLLNQIKNNINQPPTSITPNIEGSLKEFQPVYTEGLLLTDNLIYIDNKVKNHKVGYDVFAVLLRVDGPPLLINLGWFEKKLDSSMPHLEQNVESTITTIHGYIRFQPQHSNMTIKNDPQRNIWFYPDIVEMKKFYELDDVSHYFLYQTQGYIPKKAESFSFHQPNIKHIPNNHSSYAFTWFSLALIAIVIFAIFHYDPKRNK